MCINGYQKNKARKENITFHCLFIQNPLDTHVFLRKDVAQPTHR